MIKVATGLSTVFALVGLCACAGGETDTDGSVDAPDVTDAVDTSADTGSDPDAFDGDTEEDTSEDTIEDGDVRDLLGTPCSGNWDCQDGVYCNGVEVCEGGYCQRGIAIDCDDGFGCTRDECDEGAEECTHAPDDEECDDGLACNGEESCTDALGCQAGTPIDCDDDVVCTRDECNEPDGTCANTVTDTVCDDLDDCTIDTCDTVEDECENTLIDVDADEYPPASCGGPDCDDDDPTRNPGAVEACDDDIDSNCNGLPDASDPACCIGSGDTCDCPVDMSMGGLLSGTTVGMANDYCGSCGASPCSFDGSDVAFYLPISERSMVQWAFAAMDWSFYFHLHSDSCTGPEVTCQNYISSGSTISQILDAGFYYFILDSADLVSSGDYNIATLITPLSDATGNDTCATAIPASVGRAYSGSLVGHTDDYDPPAGCTYDPDGRDVAFRLELSVGANLEMTTSGSAVDTYLYVLDGSCSAAGLPCDDNSGGGSGYYYWGASRIMTWFDPGTYYIIVDENSWYSYGDDYILSVSTY